MSVTLLYFFFFFGLENYEFSPQSVYPGQELHSLSTQSCRPSFLSAYISVDSQHVVPASLRRHVGISVHIGRSRRIDATSQLRLRLMTSITLAHFWLLLQSRYSRCRNQGGFRLRFTRSLIFLVDLYNIVSYADVGFLKVSTHSLS